MHGRADIEASEPRVSRAVVEQARIGAVVRQRARKRSTSHKPTRKTNAFAKWGRLKLKARQIGAINRKSQSAKIAVAKYRRIQDIDPFIINTFDDSASEVHAWIQHLGNCVRYWIANNQSGKAILEINDEL